MAKSVYSPKELSTFMMVAERVMGAYLRLPKNKGTTRRGGALTIMDAANGLPLLIFPVGELAQEKVFKYFKLSLEKAERVYNTGQRTSRVTRDPEKGLWGGAVRIGGIIISFSGLPELDDEAFGMAFAVICRMTNRADILQKNDNAEIESTFRDVIHLLETAR